MSTVYLVQQLRALPGRPPRDLTPISQYGKIVTLIEPSDNASINPELVRSKVADRLKDFKPEEDYLVWIGGDPVGVAIITSDLLRRGITKFCWLRYTHKRDLSGKVTDLPDYLPTWLDFTAPPILRPASAWLKRS